MNESARMDQNIKEKNCCHYLLEKLEVCTGMFTLLVLTDEYPIIKLVLSSSVTTVNVVTSAKADLPAINLLIKLGVTSIQKEVSLILLILVRQVLNYQLIG